MQPRPLLMKTLSTITSRYCSQLIDLIVAEQDLGEARPVRLDARIAAVAIDGRRAAEDQAAVAAVEHGGADIAFARIDRNRLARNAGLEERFAPCGTASTAPADRASAPGRSAAG